VRPQNSRRAQKPNAIGIALGIFAFGSVGLEGWLNPMLQAAVFTLLFLVALLSKSSADRPWNPIPWAVLGVLFLAAVVALLLAMTPFAPGGANPLWQMVGAQGGAAINVEGQFNGLLELGGLAFAFLTSAMVGRRATGLSTMLLAAKVAGGLVGALVLLNYAVQPLIDPLIEQSLPSIFKDRDLSGTLFGILLIIAAQTAWQARLQGAASVGQLFKTSNTRLSAAVVIVALLGLALDANVGWMAVSGLMAVVLLGWSALAAGGHGKITTRIMVWLVSGMTVLAVVVGWIILSSFPVSGAKTRLLDVHWRAFWASPWLGYGLGTMREVGELFSTQLDANTLHDHSIPQTYLDWMEAGGLLAAIPLVSIPLVATMMVMLGAQRATKSAGAMRAAVCASLFLGLMGMRAYAPADTTIIAVCLILLGGGWGIATSIRH
jgi:hypothetical protein